MKSEAKDMFEELLSNPATTQFETATIMDSMISLIYVAFFGWLISQIYSRFGQSVAGGRRVKVALWPLAIIVFVTISVVKSSLALSLGLVGALSIVRFRTPIKDPEDLIYLFLAIVAGLGFGAGQNLFTGIGVSVVLILMVMRSAKYKGAPGQYNIVIDWLDDVEFSVDRLFSLLSEHCTSVSLIRYDSVGKQKSMVLQITSKSGSSVDDVSEIFSELTEVIDFQISDAGIDW